MVTLSGGKGNLRRRWVLWKMPAEKLVVRYVYVFSGVEVTFGISRSEKNGVWLVGN